MSSTSMGGGKSVVRPPQRGIFPLDHMAECARPMQKYLDCLKENSDHHHKCRELSREYLQCRMDHGLMSVENLDDLGFSEKAEVKGPREYDNAKEKQGFVAGKHIIPKEKSESSWWQFWR